MNPGNFVLCHQILVGIYDMVDIEKTRTIQFRFFHVIFFYFLSQTKWIWFYFGFLCVELMDLYTISKQHTVGCIVA